MRPKFLLLLLAAVLVAGLTGLLLMNILDSERQSAARQATAAPPPPVTTDILVLAQDAVPGHLLTADDLRWRPWPADATDDRMIRRDKDGDAQKTSLLGKMPKRPLLTGEPLSADLLVSPGAGAPLAALLPPGKRAVSLAVTPVAGVAGFILPQDHVDVLLSLSVPQTGGGGLNKRTASEILLKNLLVIAVDDRLAPPPLNAPPGDTKAAGGNTSPPQPGNIPARTITLAVAAEQAATLQTAIRAGDVTLALCALQDQDTAPPGAAPIPASSSPAAALSPSAPPAAVPAADPARPVALVIADPATLSPATAAVPVALDTTVSKAAETLQNIVLQAPIGPVPPPVTTAAPDPAPSESRPRRSARQPDALIRISRGTQISEERLAP